MAHDLNNVRDATKHCIVVKIVKKHNGKNIRRFVRVDSVLSKVDPGIFS